MKTTHKKGIRLLVAKEDSGFYLDADTWLGWVKDNKPEVYKKITKDTPEAILARAAWGWRLTTGRTQAQAAKLAGCSVATYQNIEECRKGVNPSYLGLCRIAGSYKTSLAVFLLGPGKLTLST
jgi:DNA-binding XRE family transcriptional regulator